MEPPLDEAVRELIRSYRMNWSSLKQIGRQDCTLGVAIDLRGGEAHPAYTLINIATSEILEDFASLKEAEMSILTEASRIYGVVGSPEEAAARHEQVLNAMRTG